MDKRSIWIFSGIFLYFSSCIRLFSINCIDLEVSPLIDQFSRNETSFILSWIAISLIAKTIGAKLFGEFADKYNILNAIRVLAATNVITSSFITICFLTKVWFFNPNYFFYLARFTQAFLEPAVLILSAIFLIKINKNVSAIYISALVNLVAGSGILSAYIVSNLINGYKISNWYLLLFAVSVVILGIFTKGTKSNNYDKNIPLITNFTKRKHGKMLIFSSGACCLAAIASIHFCFDRFVHDRLFIGNFWQTFSSIYFYIYLLVIFIPAALIANKVGIENAAKSGITGSIITTLIIYLAPFNSIFLIIIGLLNVFFIALFLVSNYTLLYDLYYETHQYQMVIVWFTLGFVVFGVFNTFLQILSFWPLQIVGILSSIPGMLMHFIYRFKIDTSQNNQCFSFLPTTLNYTFSFKRWRIPNKTSSANISLVYTSC